MTSLTELLTLKFYFFFNFSIQYIGVEKALI